MGFTQFHVPLIELLTLGTLFSGLTLMVLLWLTKNDCQRSGRLLSLALGVTLLKIAGLPAGLLLAFGPLLYLYTAQLINPAQQFRRIDLLYFCPLLVAYWTPAWLAIPVILLYLLLSYRLIQQFYARLQPLFMDRPRFAFRALRYRLLLLGALCLLALLNSVFYLVMALALIIMGVVTLVKLEVNLPPVTSHADEREKARRLKAAVAAGRFYEDAELTLTSLAVKLNIHPHELSRIINQGLKKNFSDFINESRVREVARKMRDPAFDRFTLLGIAYACGFNSQSSFNRIFKQVTGKSPQDYKNEQSIYKLGNPGAFRPLVLSHTTLNGYRMFKNYLKIAWRSLWKHQSHSFINIAGLVVGLACSLLIGLWIQNEYSVDGFFENSDRLFKVYKTNFDHKVPSGGYETPGILADELKRTFPDIQYATNMGFGEQSAFQVGEKVVKMNGNSAGADFFKMFSYPLLAGTAGTALNSPDAIAISRNMAEIFYGSPGNAIGKTIRYQNQKDFKITAVFENLPKNASQSFDFLTNWAAFLNNTPWARDMGNTGPSAYVMLRPGANVAAVNAKIAHVFDGYYHINRSTAGWYTDIALQPYAEAYLHNDLATGKPAGGRIEYVHLFSIIAVFILLIACINFMNLSTARSVKRAKEVGVRKVAGALRGSLIWQFITESLLITLIAVSIALVLVLLFLPEFNLITQKRLGLPFANPVFWLTIAGTTLVTGLLSGSYPALYLSAFKPIKVLKSAVKLDTGTLFFRKGLVVFQFVLSVVLITGTIIVSRQMNYLTSKDLGYERENVVYLPIEGKLASGYDVFKNELLSRPGIQAVSYISSAPIDIYGSSPAVNWTGHDSTSNIMFTRAVIGYDYFKTMKLTLLAGREFSRAYPSDSSGYILNETALKLTGYKEPIGQPFTYMGKKGTIIGVVKDFHFHSLHEAIGPMVLAPGEKDKWGVVLVRTQPGKTQAALANIQQVCKEINPAFPPVIYFMDEQYQQLYQNDQVINQLADIFAVLAIFISCLGLLGLAMFTAEQRVKEIGIRKVLGAGIGSLFTLLSAEFMTLIGIAIAIALPLAWYATHSWLQSFAYRSPLQWWVFALSGGLIIMIALVTISFQLVRAALTNPVKSLRSE